MLKNNSLLILLTLTVFFACKSKKNIPTVINNLDTINIVPQNEISKYEASAKREVDIIDMNLNISFNYDSLTMDGQAVLKIKAYNKPISSITLDANTFIIKNITYQAFDSKTCGVKIPYTYINNKVTIDLPKPLLDSQGCILDITYIAQPEKIKSKKGNAITDEKGIYFINPHLKLTDVPRQIWTQGETQGASCWFPTIDSPNEKFTHTISITAYNNETTLSNGELKKINDNKNGTHTDIWQMNLQHSPYLVMVAIGEFEKIKDKWNNKEINYYVEKKYAPYAKKNMGETPKMIDFFSNIFGVKYPWQKYSQIVVRDFVSGAMENTTATIHSEFLNKTNEEIYDAHPYAFYQEVIAHELAHHWFGDYVTCESWSNIPLNESFASYAEYLWVENRYGKIAAQNHLQSQLSAYMNEAAQKQVPLIRYDYGSSDDLFDAHSYEKGSCILHMLRTYLGDQIFFKSLKKYLTQYALKNTELAQIRMVFEEGVAKI